MAVTVRFIVRKGVSLKFPRAEDDDHVWLMGIHPDLDEAMEIATEQVVDYLVHILGMEDDDAYRLASLAGDFKVAEAVNVHKVVIAEVHKDRLRPLVGGADVPVVGCELHPPAGS